tara:strand:+ start:140 stop:1387 length:1248 start_codon:yes stop_codon:yes gene_type:complete
MASTTSGGLMKSIFGGGPQTLTNQRYATIRSEADDIINTTNKIQSPGEAIGGAFGTPFGKEFGGGLARGLLGDPEMEAAQQEEAFLQELSRTYEINSPEFLDEFARYKQSQGDFDKASQLTELSNKTKGKLLTAQNEEIQKESFSKLLINPARQDLIQEYIKAGGDPKIVIDLLQQQNSKNPSNKQNISNSLKKFRELVAEGVGEDSALDIAFNISQVYTDPSTGDLIKYDPRDLNKNNNTSDSNKNNNKIIRKGTKQEEILETKVTDLSEALEKSDILEMSGIFNLIDKQILQTEGDISGLGGTGKFPAIFLSTEGLKNRQLLSQLQNITLKNRSGAAVTATEFDRLKTELGTGALSTDAQVRNALIRMKQLFDDHTKRMRAGYSDEVNALYDKRVNLPAGGRLKYNSDTGEFE